MIHPVSLLRSWTPVEPMCPCLGGHIGAAPTSGTVKASDDEHFGAHSRSFGTCSPTLRASCCHSRARLASGWLAGLYREGVEPSGSLRKVSDHMTILLSCSPDATQIAADLTHRPTRQPWANYGRAERGFSFLPVAWTGPPGHGRACARQLDHPVGVHVIQARLHAPGDRHQHATRSGMSSADLVGVTGCPAFAGHDPPERSKRHSRCAR